MNRIVIASVFFVYALLGRDASARVDVAPPGPLKILQSSGTQAWSVTEVGEEGDPYVYDITVQPAAGGGGIEFDYTGFEISRDPEFPTASITIHKLTVVRPLDATKRLFVTVGDNDTIVVDEVAVTPWGTDSRKGYTRVSIDLVGGSGVGVLGHVHGANYFQADVAFGNVAGPIECSMHPLATTDPQAEPDYNCTIKLSGTGNLLGDVTMESWDGSTDENYPTDKLGHISWVDFQTSTIGAENDKVDIRADYAIEFVWARNIHANIMGTDTDRGDPDFDSYVSLIGRVYADRTNSTSSDGNFTGEIRVEELNDVPLVSRTATFESILVERQMSATPAA